MATKAGFSSTWMDPGAKPIVGAAIRHASCKIFVMIRKLKTGDYRLYSRKLDPKTGRRRNLGTFRSRSAAEKHERAVQYFKHR